MPWQPIFFQSIANEYILRLSDGLGLGFGGVDFSIYSRFCHSTGSFVDGKRTGLSGYMFREMAGKVRTREPKNLPKLS